MLDLNHPDSQRTVTASAHIDRVRRAATDMQREPSVSNIRVWNEAHAELHAFLAGAFAKERSQWAVIVAELSAAPQTQDANERIQASLVSLEKITGALWI